MGGGHEHSHEHDDGHNGWLFGEDVRLHPRGGGEGRVAGLPLLHAGMQIPRASCGACVRAFDDGKGRGREFWLRVERRRRGGDMGVVRRGGGRGNMHDWRALANALLALFVCPAS